MKTISVLKVIAVAMFVILPFSIATEVNATTNNAFMDSMSPTPAEVLANSKMMMKTCFNVPYSKEVAIDPPNEEITEELSNLQAQKIPNIAFLQEDVRLYYFDHGEEASTICLFYFE